MMESKMRMGGIEVRTGVPCFKCGSQERVYDNRIGRSIIGPTKYFYRQSTEKCAGCGETMLYAASNNLLSRATYGGRRLAGIYLQEMWEEQNE